MSIARYNWCTKCHSRHCHNLAFYPAVYCENCHKKHKEDFNKVRES